MNERIAKKENVWLIGFGFGLFFGACFGIVDGALSLGDSNHYIAQGTMFNVPFRILIAAAFYAQIFIGANLGFTPLLVIVRRLMPKRIPAVAIVFAYNLVLCAAMPLWVELNRILPSFRSAKSIAGNLLFALFALGLTVVIGLILRNKTEAIRRLAPHRLWAIGASEILAIAVLIAAFIPAPITTPKRTTNANKPNILLITVDTLRADHLSRYGYTNIRTPNIDSIGEQGVTFDRFLSSTSWTLPALTTMMTGVHQKIHGMMKNDVALDKSFVTLASRMKDAGYATQAVVTNQYLNHPYRLDRGFDRYQFSDDPTAYPPLSGLLIFDFLFPKQNERHSAENMTRRAVDVLERLKHRPFFLWVHYIDPHTPYSAWYIDRFPESASGYSGPIGREFTDIPGIENGTLKLNDADRQQIINLYDAEIMYVDRQIGVLLAALDRLGLKENTAVIFTSDHGEEFWDHGGLIHGRTLYTESVHVPLFIRHPKRLPKNLRVGSITSMVELTPAIASIAGLQPLKIYQGKSLLRKLIDDTDSTAFLDLMKDGEYSIAGYYDKDIAYIRSRSPKRYVDVYSTTDDFLQKKNLAPQQSELLPGYQEKLKTMRRANLEIRRTLNLSESENRFELTDDMTDSLRALGYVE